MAPAARHFGAKLRKDTMARILPPAPPSALPAALLLLGWHALLAADYVITRFQLGAPGWPVLMASLPLDALWLRVVWALGVWLGFGAAFFLLIRDNAAVLLFFAAGASFAALAVGLVMGAPPVIFVPLPALLALLVLVPMAGWLYVRRLNQRGLLR